MQKYDIATKVLMETCRDELIRRFLGIQVKSSNMIQLLPQETVSLKRSDYPVLVTDAMDVTRLVILEILTFWRWDAVLNLLDYRTRYLLQHEYEAISCIILLRPSSVATDCWEDNEVRFRYKLVKIYEMDARSVIPNGPLCLAPFIPLMKHGEETIEEADLLIYQSQLPKDTKADMLSSMAILSGLISDSMPVELIKRRRDIMIESAAYDIIKQEGRLEGFQDGEKQGLRKGLLKNLQLLLELKFGVEGIGLYRQLKDIQDTDIIDSVTDAVRIAKTPEDILKISGLKMPVGDA